MKCIALWAALFMAGSVSATPILPSDAEPCTLKVLVTKHRPARSIQNGTLLAWVVVYSRTPSQFDEECTEEAGLEFPEPLLDWPEPVAAVPNLPEYHEPRGMPPRLYWWPPIPHRSHAARRPVGVPEPSGFLLMLVGIGAVAALRKQSA